MFDYRAYAPLNTLLAGLVFSFVRQTFGLAFFFLVLSVRLP